MPPRSLPLGNVQRNVLQPGAALQGQNPHQYIRHEKELLVQAWTISTKLKLYELVQVRYPSRWLRVEYPREAFFESRPQNFCTRVLCPMTPC